MASIKDQLTTKFSAEQNGVKLGGAVVAVLADYLENVVKVEDVGEVDEYSLEATLKEAWEAKHEVDLPSMHANKLLMWLGVTQAQVLLFPAPEKGGERAALPDTPIPQLHLGQWRFVQ